MRLKRSLTWLSAAAALAVAVVAMPRCRSISVAPEARLDGYDVSPYRTLLEGGVRDGLVDYAAIRERHADDLDRYLDAVGRFGPTRTPAVFPSGDDALAYSLNAYNALMLKRWLVAGAGRDDEPRTVNKLWFFLDRWKVDGQWVSLDTLEQRRIRPTFREPRIHFALVCGAMGCPPLLEEPFDGETIDAQLDDLGRRWLREPDALEIDADGTVRMSAIFKWYRADFAPMGGLAGMLERYLDPDDPRRPPALAAAREDCIEFMPYDWAINQGEGAKGLRD